MEPVDVNGINNIAAEWYYRLYHNIHGMWTCSLRLTNTYGPRHQMKHPRQGVLNWFIRQVLDGQEITLYGTGRQVRDVNFVDDVVQAFMMAADSDKANGQVFNIGGDAVSLEDFVKKVIEVLGHGTYTTKAFPNDRKAIEVGDYVADWSKIKKTLGWKPVVSLHDGIKKTIEYYRKNKNRYW
jgi:UDP-glucose 4-epimerase